MAARGTGAKRAGSSAVGATAGAARPPQQQRGQRRVEAILDATAALITEEGVAGATMHAIAKRSSTTIGSLYHFFPDREAVLVALVDRHLRGIGAMVVLALASRLTGKPAGVWFWWLLQAAILATGFIEPFMFAVAVVFLALWVFCFVKGGQLDRMNAARRAAIGED